MCCSQQVLSSLAAGALPLDLLRRALQAAVEQLPEDQQLAQLARLACVCHHWQAAAGEVARHFSTPQLSCRQLTPLLRGWVPGWTRLDLTLDAHGVPPGLLPFLRASSALACASLRGVGNTRRRDTAAVERALAKAPALQELRCLTFRPAALPRGLRRLYISCEVDWSGRLLEKLFLKLQLLPELEHIEIGVDCREVVLSDECLAGLELPSLLMFELLLEEVAHDTVLDLSWLGSDERVFEFNLVLFSDNSRDELLRFCETVSQVHQPQDELILCSCVFLCEAAQLHLAQLELWYFYVSMPEGQVIRALPKAALVRVAVRLHDWDFDRPHGPAQFYLDVSWDAVKAAMAELTVELDLCLDRVHAPYSFEVEVTGCPGSGLAGLWQATLADAAEPWRASFTGFTQVSGLPPATSSGPQRYELQNAASLACSG